MILKKIIIEGFKSFAEKQEFNFGNNKGIYFLSGVNKVDKSLGSNGAGKSTIWDALCWCLYGKTVRGLKADSLCTWFKSKSNYNVTLYWEKDDVDYQLYRSWGPNKLQLNNKDVEQYKIDEVFGIPYTPFLFSVLMGQSRPMFFDLKESNKAVLFSEIFQLDRWIELSEKVTNDTKDLEQVLIDIDRSIDKSLIEVKTLNRELENYKGLNNTWKKDNTEKVKLIKEKIKKLKNEIVYILKKGDKNHIEKKHIEYEIELVVKEIDKNKEIICDKEDVTNKLDFLIKSEKEYLDDCNEKLKFLKRGVGECPKCNQKIKRTYALKEINFIKNEIKKQDVNYHRKVNKKQELKKDLNLCFSLLQPLERKQKILLNNMNEINSDIAYLNGSLKSLKRELESYEFDIKDIEREINPFSKSIRNNNIDIYHIKLKVIKLKRIYGIVVEKKEQTKFWIKGFKDIRLFVISEFLIQLEIEVNNALSKLGLPEWKISFDIEKETKSKTIKKGFQVLIHSPNNDKIVPWESWSGGESQRLRLAGNMGLSSLILSQYNINPNIEIWDEPSSHLGKEGINDLLETLHDRAQNTNKCLWVIEHNNLDFNNFEKVVTIIKTEKGSIINNGE